MRVAAGAALLAGLGIWVAVGLAPVLAERLPAERVLDPNGAGVLLAWWSDERARESARAALRDGDDLALRRAADLLERVVETRPLHAPTWLLRGRLAAGRGRIADAQELTSHARALWPHREHHLWNVAMVQGLLPTPEPALATLREVLRLTRTRIGLASQQARRLEPDAARRADALLPPPDWTPETARRHLERLLHLAAHHADPVLAERAWSALGAEDRRRPQAAARYVDLLLALDRVESAREVWRGVDVESADERVGNGGFEQPLTNAGLGWIAIERPGVRVTRDAWLRAEGRHSLSVEFTRVREPYHHLFQRVIVRPATRYRVQARWRGERVGRHARPSLFVRAAFKGELLAQSRSRVERWDWDDVAFDFEVPVDVRVIELGLRRAARTERVAEGRIWIDDVRLTRLGSES